MKPQMDSRFNHNELEPKIYSRWEKSGFFNPDKLVAGGVTKKNAKTFSIALPPPNVTGTLHMGHAAMLAIEDIMIRFNRMRGKKTLWVPGTDHAAIATQSKVEGIIYKKEKKTKHDLGREKFLARVEKFAKESHGTITNQVKRMGASVDWSREAYTLDTQRSLAVRTAFKSMHDDGLIYKGARIVNWDPKLQTTVSDDEVERIEEKSSFYYLKYGPFVIGTARPETKFGDKYIVIHPSDKRYKKYKHRDEIKVNWINGKITATIIKDKAVDMDFGTGVMTITPWHDLTDFEIAERHKLDKEQIIDYKGKLLSIAEEFKGMHISKARPLIVEKLKKKKLLVREDKKYVHNIAVNSRGGGVIEPQVKEQWFVDVNKKFALKNSKIKGVKQNQMVNLKELMQKTVRSGQIEILPARFKKTYFHWIDNLRDWCISRQLWYGHRIPVWYRSTNAHGKQTHVGVNPPQGTGWEQDPDTLDTWFSSALWTFSTLGWPKNTKDLKQFHPTNVLETGYDILFFWVARMILMSGYHLGDIPFEKVYLHGLIRDEKGRKMSKSLGNIIDPLDLIEKYGADATRLSLIIGAGPGGDMKLSEDKVRGYRNFATKIWNASRFVIMNYDDTLKAKPVYTKSDRANLTKLKSIKKQVTKDLEEFKFHRAAETLYHYFWHTFADKIIEQSKSRLESENDSDKAAAQAMLLTILTETIKMLHPFVPYVTEAVWSRLPSANRKRNLLIIEPW